MLGTICSIQAPASVTVNGETEQAPPLHLFPATMPVLARQPRVAVALSQGAGAGACWLAGFVIRGRQPSAGRGT